MSAQPYTTGHEVTAGQVNGVVRPQEGATSSGAVTQGGFLDAAGSPLQTASADVDVDRGRVQDEGAEVSNVGEALAQEQTAADVAGAQEGAAADSGVFNLPYQEAQAGVQFGSQGPSDTADLAGQAVDPEAHMIGAGRGGMGIDFHTPRSAMGSHVAGFSASRGGHQGQWPGWVTRLGDFFRPPPIPNTWLPSPIPSPPMRTQVGTSLGPPYRPVRADGTVGEARVVPKGVRHGALNTTPSSSSISAEAIQAEVQRQMGSILNRLSEVEADNARLQRELYEERSKPAMGATSIKQSPPLRAGEPSNRDEPSNGVRGEHADVSRPTEGRGEAWSKIWEGITAKLPSRTTHAAVAEVPVQSAPARPKMSDVPEASTTTGAGRHEGLGVIEALAQSMRQLQELQVKALTKTDADGDSPEVVKTAVTTLPTLDSPEGDQCGLVFQDWMVQITTAMQDLSTSSGVWWESVKEVVLKAYTRWLAASPIERLGIEPAGSQDLTSGRYVRVNARSCAMVLQAIPEAIKVDLIARRATQSMPSLLFRLYTVYQPGGAGERSVILQRLQGGEKPSTVVECLRQLRAWPRWVQRCQDMGMSVPDGTVLAQGLTNLTAGAIGSVPDAMFRTQLVRATLRIDQQPSLSDVMKYQQHLQAEVENLEASSTTTRTTPSVKAMTPAQGGTQGGAGSAKPGCKFFLKPGGCRRGSKCPFTHDMSSLSKVDRARKCLVCGSEDHRQRECPTKSGRPSPTRSTTTAEQSPKAGETQVRNRSEPESETSPKAIASVETAPGQPVLSWETLLQAAAKVAGVPPEAKAPTLKVLAIRTDVESTDSGTGAYALVDSGATHPLRRAVDMSEWTAASPVVVHLAGGEVVQLKMNQAGTLLVPSTGTTRTASTAPIVPLGSLVGTLGYRMDWHGSRCRLVGREGDVLNLRVRDGCPEITEQQALNLIARIEDKKLESLKSATEITRARVREAAVSLDKTWFDHLLAYCESGMSPEALLAVDGAPFFEGVPRQALQGLVEAVPFTNGWDALKGLVHLNRKARKRLWESSQWVVHLYAGKRPNEEILFLERQGFVVLELDIERGKSHDVNNPLVWRALEWGARHGRIASVIGGPPQNSFMLRRSMTPGPEALRSEDYPYGGWEGQPAAEVDYVNKHTGYFAKMIYLHALATAGRCKFPPDPADVREVGFMLEQPRDPRGYLLFTDPLYQDARSFWRTPMWFYYAEEAGLSTYSFDMSSLGKKLVRHTTIGTNLPLRHLDGLRGRTQLDPFPPEAAPPSVWSREFSENVAIAVRAQRQTPRMLKMSTDQWREHVRRGHLPYRSDCLTCVMAGATGRRHARVEHPSCFTMSADVSGPLKVPGLDADARGAFPRPHKYLFVAKVRIPKTFVDDGRGTFIEYDPGELEEEGPKEEGSFDFQEESPQGDDPVLPQENEADQEEDDEEVEKASKGDPQRYEDDLDMTGPELVNLVFAAAIPDNKSTTVLEMIQDVILYCSALNIPVFRFHCDRGMEFYAKATRQWLKYHGIRFTTSEGGLHQQNGVVENAVKYVKQRARTLLHGAKLPQRLWPQAVAMAAAAQRATALGYETKLAAPFGARVLVRKREYGGSAEPGKPDDLAPRWVEGSYLGLSETVRRGHVIYVVDKETEKFIHTVHVRTDLVEPEITDIVEAELPGPPSRRLRSKAAGSGDVVSISKAQTVVSDDDLRAQTEALKDSWSQEEAENLCVQIALMLGPNEKIFGAFRHGGAVGLTKATFERQWAAEFLVKTFVMKCPDAEFTSLYVSVNSQRDLHIDSNNMMGKNNYLYPVAMPRRGGDLWVEISDGDVVRGKVTEMMDGRGVPHYGCILPLEQGHITMFNPHRRHAVRSWKGLRVVLVGYTPGVIRKLPGTDREVLSNLGFPISPEGEELIPEVAIRAFSVCPGAQRDFQKGVEEEPWADHDPSNRTCEKGESSSEEEMINDEFATLVREEEVEHWDMFLPLEQGDPNVVPKAKIASSGGVINMNKVEVTYTHNIESLLSSLSSPLAIVHTVEPKEAQDNFGKWLPAVKKELSSFDHTVTKRCARDPQVIDDIRSGRAKVVPMKIVYTVKPPNEGSSEWFRRKARIVACGNMMAASGEDNYAAAAPAEVVRSSLAISSRRGWDAGVIDITSAFLQTPLSKVDCRFRVFGQPPRALIREGLCEEHELWEFTHAVYGLRESPKWWGEFRDSTLANLVVEIEGRKVTLVRCRVESSWWKLVEDSAVIGVIVIYVDDILICSTNSVIAAVANSIKELWSTSPLAMASEGAIKFLGLEIEKIEGGFAVSQADYIAELLRIHNVKGTQRDLIPVSRETASFVATEEEAVFSEAELREAQQYAGEILWLSQRSRPDLSYAASLISSLTTKAPRRASSITRKCLGFLQRTADHRLHLVSRSQELVSWTDASFAPEGARSHTGWLIAAGDAPLSWRSSRQSTVTLSTAEAELVASVEGALALCSLYALWKEIEEEELKLILKTDSTSSIAIQHGSGSWRTRHLRIKAAWIGEKVERGEISIEHCAGKIQLADALTKPLSSARLQQLSMMAGLLSKRDYTQDESESVRSSTNLGLSKILVALIILSQAIIPARAMDTMALGSFHQPLSVDHGMVMWCVFGLIVLLWTLAWEFLKYAGWQLYFTAAPGAESRRLRRLQKIRDHTALAIQHELEARRENSRDPIEIRRARNLHRNPLEPLGSPGRAESSERASSSSGAARTVYKATQKDRAVQTTGPSFAPLTPTVRTEIRIPDQVFYVPGGQCYHVFNPCHAFRHRGTQEKVQRLRICEYCARHQGRDPQLGGPSIDDILRSGNLPNFDRPGIQP